MKLLGAFLFLLNLLSCLEVVLSFQMRGLGRMCMNGTKLSAIRYWLYAYECGPINYHYLVHISMTRFFFSLYADPW